MAVQKQAQLGAGGKKKSQFHTAGVSQHSPGPCGSNAERQGYRKKVSRPLSQVRTLPIERGKQSELPG